MLDPFFADVLEELARIDREQRSPYASQMHARDAIFVELAGLRHEINRPAGQHSWLAARKRWVAIAAICRRVCRDLAIETKADAAGKDIPF